MKKTALAFATAALSTALLAGCGGGGSDKYCDDLKSAKNDFSSLGASNVDKLDEAFDAFHKLAGEAPSDVKDDWKTLDDAIKTVEKALSDAGIKTSDLAQIQQGKMPKGVDAAKLQKVASQFSGLNSSKFDKASKAIEKHAKDECKVDLS